MTSLDWEQFDKVIADANEATRSNLLGAPMPVESYIALGRTCRLQGKSALDGVLHYVSSPIEGVTVSIVHDPVTEYWRINVERAGSGSAGVATATGTGRTLKVTETDCLTHVQDQLVNLQLLKATIDSGVQASPNP